VKTFDVAVIGTGSMGSATAYQLAKRGLKVIAFEQFRVVHEMGSHSGSTRIIRHAYHESPDYVPLVLRSDFLWRELEELSQKKLLIRTGGVDLGPQDGTVVRDALLACNEHNLPYEHLSGREVMQRWPQFRIPEDWHGCYDPNMGFLIVNDCIRSYAEAARIHGAEIHEEEPVLDYRVKENIVIKTAKQEYFVAHAIFCSGAWSGKILQELNLPLTVKRKTLVWLAVENPQQFEIGNFPIFLTDTSAGLLYGFPLYGHLGMKIANHHAAGSPVDPDHVDREFQPIDALDAQSFAAAHLIGVSTNVLEGKICLYTMTPDEHFLIDFHPEHGNVLFATGFSGHGFKFAPVVGEILADLMIDRKTAHPIQKFRLSRF
jgi:monomeric sarcosine oxidase